MRGSDQMTARRAGHHAPSVVAGLTALLLLSSAVNAAPAIRTSVTNRVPACATPERLTAFLTDRNPGLDPRFRDIARWYKHWGDAWRVRWDYAFYQMILETNALKYRRGDGRRGDVHETQNNFAGIGATGRGAPGDRFPDIKTGVHAQIQHLVAYSGEMLADPIAPRTQLVQDSIVTQSKRLRRAVTFGDLARRWAVDRAYARSIDGVAEQFKTTYCSSTAANAAPIRAVPAPIPAQPPATRKKLSAFAPPSGLGGPKPLKLAGPDTLPWSGTDGQQPAPDATGQNSAPALNDAPRDTPGHESTAAHPHDAPLAGSPGRSPVRTIWSRDGQVTPVAGTPRPVESAKAVPAPHVNAPAAALETGDELPHFKIGPLTPAPSRLGGPVDVMPAAVPQPSARFGDVITAAPADAESDAAPGNGPSAEGSCRVLSASYGGRKTLLVRANVEGETRYTALTVLDGFEKSMFDIYTKASAPGAEIVGEYPSKEDALADARTNCPG
ncbi:MAG: hypothetical protein ABL897_06320 [Hyphomicrobium sp.]